MKRPT